MTIFNAQVRKYEDRDALAEGLSGYISSVGGEFIKNSGRFTIALSGGRTPQDLYSMLAVQNSLLWDKVHVFWTDERFVPKQSEFSNYGAVHERLISRIRIPDKNIHPVNTDLPSPEESAGEYGARLRNFFKVGQNIFPSMDMMLLGIGADGHTASLFNGGKLENLSACAINTVAPAGVDVPDRITVTAPVINKSRNIVFIVSGADKYNMLKSLLSDDKAARSFAVSALKPEGKVVIFADKAALEGE